MSNGFDIGVFKDRLEQGAAKIGQPLTPEQIGLMAGHARELAAWNKKINLTAIKDPGQMAEKHFVDAVAVLKFIGEDIRIMDMGTGGGFPAIPLKILNPAISFTMVDSVRKKVNFLNHVVRTLELEGIQALHGRVEDLAKDPDHAQGYDAVISRGFANLEKFADFALPLLSAKGRIYALKGNLDEITPELEARFHITHDHYCLPFEKSDRYLVTLSLKQVSINAENPIIKK